jgi:molybdopterin-biosynthesis enzyme MoeA-like protein
MSTPNSSASKEVVTAALLVIGGKILSGRTKDQNIGYIAEYLTAVDIDLKEVRVVGDEETAIVDALDALRHRYTYVFTTGGIGPTHGDITADAHSQGRGSHPQQGVGGAWFLDRQCNRDGGRALDHAGDAR